MYYRCGFVGISICQDKMDQVQYESKVMQKVPNRALLLKVRYM